MKLACVLPFLLAATGLALAQEEDEEELTAYEIVEIEDFLKLFKQTSKNTKLPEEDAIAALENLKKAYAYLESKGEKITKEEAKIQKKIVTDVTKGLKVRKRPLVTLECAKALGEMPEKASAKAIFRWMDSKVLDARSPNPVWVEAGFLSMAHIGGQDKATLDLLRSYATGKHLDIGVASQALRACYEWRALNGRNRQELFGKINLYLGGLWSGKQGGDPKKRGLYDKRWNTVKDEGLKALRFLSGNTKGFANPPAAMEWWKDNKKRKWEPYVGPKFRKKTVPEKKDAEEKKPEEEGGT